MAEVRIVDIETMSWEDARGWGINPLAVSGTVNVLPVNIHVVSLKPGHIRGNHYHRGTAEWMLICGGPARFLWKTVDEQTVREIITREGKPTLLEIPPTVEHAVMNAGGNDIYLMVFDAGSDPDTVRCPSLFDMV